MMGLTLQSEATVYQSLMSARTPKHACDPVTYVPGRFRNRYGISHD